MALFKPRRIALLLCMVIVGVVARKHAASVAQMSLEDIEDGLQVDFQFPLSPILPSSRVILARHTRFSDLSF